jgi:hypothetical protein
LQNGNPVPRSAELGVWTKHEKVRVYCGGLFYGIGCVGSKEIKIKTLLISNEQVSGCESFKERKHPN